LTSDDRLPTALWVEAHLRKLTAEGIPYYVLNTGAYASGIVMLKLMDFAQGCRVLIQQRDLEGNLGWMETAGDTDEEKADAYIKRAIERDPDLWAIEIEARDLTNPFEGDLI
jgi:hypothetical protein